MYYFYFLSSIFENHYAETLMTDSVTIIELHSSFLMKLVWTYCIDSVITDKSSIPL